MSTGSAGQICVSGVNSALPTWSSATIDTNGNISCGNMTSAGTYIMSIDYISVIVLSQFTNIGSYPTYPYTYSTNGIVYGYIFDITGISGPSQYIVYLPTGFSNGQSIYMELIGSNSSSYNLCFQQDASYSNNIFTSYNNWVGQTNGTVAPNTLKFTYYTPASNCPWYSSGTSANCWMVQVMTVNYIPLSNKSVHLIYTNSSTAQSCFFSNAHIY